MNRTLRDISRNIFVHNYFCYKGSKSQRNEKQLFVDTLVGSGGGFLLYFFYNTLFGSSPTKDAWDF